MRRAVVDKTGPRRFVARLEHYGVSTASLSMRWKSESRLTGVALRVIAVAAIHKSFSSSEGHDAAAPT
jgi:hypothetical protein